MSYLLYLPELGRYLWGIDGQGQLRTTGERHRAWRLYERDAMAQAREVLFETGCVVELRPARQAPEVV